MNKILPHKNMWNIMNKILPYKNIRALQGQEGFSLIELMMVVVIIGVLTTVGVPQYQKFQMKAKRSEVKSLLSSMYTAQTAFFAEWGQYYEDFDAIGYGLDGDLGYLVGFISGTMYGPATHPSSFYRGLRASIYNTKQYCDRGNVCTYSKARAANTDLGFALISSGGDAFVFGGAANLDADAYKDRWSINNDRELLLLRDDIAQ